MKVDQLKKAFGIMGVPETADMKQVEERYYILMRRQKNKQQHVSQGDSDDVKTYEEITEAYKLLKAHFLEQAMADSPLYMKEQKKSPGRIKVEHFFIYYKWPLVGCIAAIVFVSLMINSYIEKKNEIPADVSVMLYGNFYLDDPAPLEQRLAETVPEWQRVKVIVAYSPSDLNSPDFAYMQKAMVLLASERPDIYIVDDMQLQRIGDQQAFMPLDQYEEMLKQKLDPSQLVYAQFEEDTAQHLYGIDLSKSPVFQKMFPEGTREIFTIRKTNIQPDIALKLINALIEGLPAADSQ